MYGYNSTFHDSANLAQKGAAPGSRSQSHDNAANDSCNAALVRVVCGDGQVASRVSSIEVEHNLFPDKLEYIGSLLANLPVVDGSVNTLMAVVIDTITSVNISRESNMDPIVQMVELTPDHGHVMLSTGSIITDLSDEDAVPTALLMWLSSPLVVAMIMGHLNPPPLKEVKGKVQICCSIQISSACEVQEVGCAKAAQFLTEERHLHHFLHCDQLQYDTVQHEDLADNLYWCNTDALCWQTFWAPLKKQLEKEGKETDAQVELVEQEKCLPTVLPKRQEMTGITSIHHLNLGGNMEEFQESSQTGEGPNIIQRGSPQFVKALPSHHGARNLLGPLHHLPALYFFNNQHHAGEYVTAHNAEVRKQNSHRLESAEKIPEIHEFPAK
ncbi:hypothetical protein FB451DRAFT_1177321 [Mycena latifolia]|nr:hypothetical protein FB451DRAFT_1177321 [Mycena latifolia]